MMSKKVKRKRVKAGILFCERGGVALILVIFVMVILMAVVREFSYSMRTEINIVRNFKEEEEAYQLALAGIEQAKMEILSIKNPADMYVNEEGILIFNQEEEEEPKRNIELGKGNFEYTIIDEDRKLDINAASLEQIKFILTDSGVDSTDADTIADSIIDWRDKNDLHMLNGAEEDYYQSLEPSYSCKDGNFETIEELLLVKGMTPEIFNGSPEDDEDEDAKEYKGVKDLFTASGTGMININTASGIVLEAMLGAGTASNIMSQRENGPISSPVKNGKVSSDFFAIISTGYNSDQTIKRTVKVIVHKKVNSIDTVYWSDNVIG